MQTRRSIPNILLNFFIKGLSIVVPIGLTIYFTGYSVFKVNEVVCYVIEYIPYLNWTIKLPGLSILVACLAIGCIGAVGSTFLVAKLVALLESILLRVPIVSILYSYIKESTFGFMEGLDQPVLVTIQYQSHAVRKLGFVTQTNLHALHLGEDEVAVYMPHSYSFSGEMGIFPQAVVKPLEISTTEAMRLVLTGGLAKIKRPIVSAKK